jgi:branched-subunit amino acid transport protein
MSDLQVWLAIAGITLATVLARSSLHLIGARLQLPPRVESALRYAPACALTAIIVPELLLVGGTLQGDWGNPKLVAGIASIAIFAVIRSTLGTIFGGMAAFWVAKAWLAM